MFGSEKRVSRKSVTRPHNVNTSFIPPYPPLKNCPSSPINYFSRSPPSRNLLNSAASDKFLHSPAVQFQFLGSNKFSKSTNVESLNSNHKPLISICSSDSSPLHTSDNNLRFNPSDDAGFLSSSSENYSKITLSDDASSPLSSPENDSRYNSSDNASCPLSSSENDSRFNSSDNASSPMDSSDSDSRFTSRENISSRIPFSKNDNFSSTGDVCSPLSAPLLTCASPFSKNDKFSMVLNPRTASPTFYQPFPWPPVILNRSTGGVASGTEVSSETSQNAGTGWSESGSVQGEQGGDTRGLSTKEYENQMAGLRKENFDLKLKLYFLEEQHGINMTDEPVVDLRQANLDLKVENESLRNSVYEKQQLVGQASLAFQELESIYQDQLQTLMAAQGEAGEKIRQLEQGLEEYQIRCEELEEALGTLQGPPADLSVLCDLAFPSSDMPPLDSREASSDRGPFAADKEKTPDTNISTSNVTYNTITNTVPNSNTNVQTGLPQFISLTTGGDFSSAKDAADANLYRQEVIALKQEIERMKKDMESRGDKLKQELVGHGAETWRTLELESMLNSANAQLQAVEPQMTLKTEQLSSQGRVIEEGKSQLEQQNKILVEIQITLEEKQRQIAELEAVLQAERNRLSDLLEAERNKMLELESRMQTEVEQRVSAVEDKNKHHNKLVEIENKMEAQVQLEKDKLVELEKKMSVDIEAENNKAVEMQKKMEVSLLAERNKAIEMEKNFNKSVVALQGFTTEVKSKEAEVAKLTKENRRLDRKCKEVVGELKETLDMLSKAKWEAETGGVDALGGMTEEENENLWAELGNTKKELARLQDRCQQLTTELERATSSKHHSHDCATVEAQLGAATATLAALRAQLQGSQSPQGPTDGNCATLLKQLVEAVETQNSKKSQDVNVNVTMQTHSSKPCQDESDASQNKEINSDASPKQEINPLGESSSSGRESNSSSRSSNDLNQRLFSLPNQTGDCTGPGNVGTESEHDVEKQPSSHALNIPNKSCDVNSSGKREVLLNSQILVLCKEFIQKLANETNSYEEKVSVYQDEFSKMANSLKISNGACQALQKRLEELSQFLEKVLEMDALGEIDLSKIAGVDKSVLYKSMDESKRLSMSVSKFNTSLRSMSMNNRMGSDDMSKSKIMHNYSSLFDGTGDVTSLTEASLLSVADITMTFEDTLPISDLPTFPSYTTLVRQFSDEMSTKLMSLELLFDSAKTDGSTVPSDELLAANVQSERSNARGQSTSSLTSLPELSGNCISALSDDNNLNESLNGAYSSDYKIQQNGMNGNKSSENRYNMNENNCSENRYNMNDNKCSENHYNSLDMSHSSRQFRQNDNATINSSDSEFSAVHEKSFSDGNKVGKLTHKLRDMQTMNEALKLELSMYRNTNGNDTTNISDISSKSKPVLKELDENIANNRRSSTSSDRCNNNTTSRSAIIERVFPMRLGETKENLSDIGKLKEKLEESIHDYDQLREQLEVALATCSAGENSNVAQLTRALLCTQEALQISRDKSDLSEQEDKHSTLESDESTLKGVRFEQFVIEKQEIEAHLSKSQGLVRHLQAQLLVSQAKIEEENGRFRSLSELVEKVKTAHENGQRENQELARRLTEANSHVQHWEKLVEKNEIVNSKRSEFVTKEKDQMMQEKDQLMKEKDKLKDELRDAKNQADVLHGKLLTLQQQNDESMTEEKRVKTVQKEQELLTVVEQLKHRCQLLEANLDESRNIQCLNESNVGERLTELEEKNNYLEAANKSLLEDKKKLEENISHFGALQKLHGNHDITMQLIDSKSGTVPSNIYDQLKKNYVQLEDDYAHLQKLYGIVQEAEKKSREQLHISNTRLAKMQLQIDSLDAQYQEKLNSMQQDASDRLGERESHLNETKARYSEKFHECEMRSREECKFMLDTKEKLKEEQKRAQESREDIHEGHKRALECEAKLKEEQRNCERKLRELESRCVLECEQLQQEVSKLVSQLELERATKESLRSELINLKFSENQSKTRSNSELVNLKLSCDISCNDDHLSMSDLATGLLDRNLASSHDRIPSQRSPTLSQRSPTLPHRSHPEIYASNTSPKSGRSFGQSETRMFALRISQDETRISPRNLATNASRVQSEKSPQMSSRRLQQVESSSSIMERLEASARCTVSGHSALVSENGHLGLRVDELSAKLEKAEARLIDALQKLSSETQRKQKVERAIGRELLKTHKVLKMAESAAVKRTK